MLVAIKHLKITISESRNPESSFSFLAVAPVVKIVREGAANPSPYEDQYRHVIRAFPIEETFNMVKDFFDGHPSAKRLAVSVAACFMLLSPAAPAAVAIASPTTTEAPAPAESAADLEKRAQSMADQKRREAAEQQKRAQEEAKRQQDTKRNGQESSGEKKDPAFANSTNTADDSKEAVILKKGLESFKNMDQKGLELHKADLQKAQELCSVYLVKRNGIGEGTAKEFCNSGSGLSLAYTYLHCRGDAGGNNSPEVCAASAFSTEAIKEVASSQKSASKSTDIFSLAKDAIGGILDEYADMYNNPQDHVGEILFDVALLAFSFTPLGAVGWAGKIGWTAAKGASKLLARGFLKETAESWAEKAAAKAAGNITKEASEAAMKIAKGEELHGVDAAKKWMADKFTGDSGKALDGMYKDKFMKKAGSIAEEKEGIAEKAVKEAKSNKYDSMINQYQAEENLALERARRRSVEMTREELKQSSLKIGEYKKEIKKEADNIPRYNRQIETEQSKAYDYYTANQAAIRSTKETFEADKEVIEKVLSKDDMKTAAASAEEGVQTSEAFNKWARRYSHSRSLKSGVRSVLLWDGARGAYNGITGDDESDKD